MDDSHFGVRNKRGDWAPNGRREVAPFWAWPPQLIKVLKWLPGYVWPWNAFHMTTALLWWFFVVPDVDTLQTLDWGWPALLLAANWVGCLIWYGAFEWRLYRQRAQGSRFKYHHKFPSESPSDVFWFKSQNLDNFLRSFLISIPLWTLVQVIFLWCWANGIGAWLTWDEHALWLTLLVLLSPALHEVHFYAIHRLIHTPTLYKWIHSIHHNSVNPSPISSLSMHPVEAFLYHAVALWHLVIPSNPVVAMFQLHAAGFGAVNGHIGFDRIELGGEQTMQSHAFLHHLHHKHFEVNFGGDGLVPLDLWLGTWHDGSKDGERQMQARYERKLARMNAGKAS
ncbi:sterol desaturase family protein [Sphaerotilus mobilis]|uniref:Sterol desaturase/sphingolipid hydroxylase (Fatty acid hydroxylase superfamily) n=1 Tax=Sphaerotilus mobilis TaxID=47994 RepID=A0A4Q7LFC6_9BURK|nr:sterol desaturase family protein [Sphaerotilus mobilis]RZS52297.1 sterol desaturase/sphingolipid hydroxylase (fatty acid hydroxylase superfamily) [Sphaerotilus mobilis]